MSPLLLREEAVRHVDKRIWRACAGASVHIPTVGSLVYYFPEGHIEQSSSPVPLPPPPPPRAPPSMVLCQISAVHFLADPVTDEVYARLLLRPLHYSDGRYYTVSPRPTLELMKENAVGFGDTGEPEEESGGKKIAAFAKILTPSDANNGGGFSVPRFCADSIFPPLDYQADPPLQTLTVTDVHGMSWSFRHIYRGTPRRHLLTTGWSKFVNHKKLVAGDSVVFMRSLRGEMFIGVRRAVRFNGGSGGSGDFARWREQIGGGEGGKGSGGRAGGSGREKLSPEAVIDAVERAVKGFPFEAVYYPKAGWYSDFVVRADVVDAALSVLWRAGMRVKMAVETDDSSRMTWFQGTVAAAALSDAGPWHGSPWRMLQVRWDEPETLQNATRVSPWQVEFVAPATTFEAISPHAKRMKFPENSRFHTDVEGELFFPFPGPTDSTLNSRSPSLLDHDIFPPSIQGTRHGVFSALGSSNLSSAPHRNFHNSSGHDKMPKLKSFSSDLNLIGSSPSDTLSPNSQCSAKSFGTDVNEIQGLNSSKVGINSIQLFGQIILMNQPVEGGFGNVVCMEDESRKGYNVKEGVQNLLRLSPTSYTQLLTQIDVQSGAEAWTT